MDESLLRRGRGRGAARRLAAALGCVAALAGVGCAAVDAAGPALQPDPAATPAAASLKPDAFGGAGSPAAEAQAVAAAHASQATHTTEGLPATPAAATIPTPVLPPSQPAPPPPPRPPAAATPVPTPAPGPTISTHASLPAATAVHARSRAAPRVRIPRAARGSTTLPVELRLRMTTVPTAAHGRAQLPAALRRAVAAPVAARERDVVPAVLGLLLLIAVSGCFLAVATASLRETAA